MKVKPAKAPGRVVVEIGRADETLLGQSESSSPFKLKKILVPTDFSECSKKALRYATVFAKQFQASITLVHVVQVYYGGGEFGPVDAAQIEQDLKESSQKQLHDLAEQEVRDGEPIDSTIRVGRPVSEVVAVAKDLDVDLIIISTHGHTGLKHVLLGSVAENLIRYAPCPVLVVREHEHEFITDPSEAARGRA